MSRAIDLIAGPTIRFVLPWLLGVLVLTAPGGAGRSLRPGPSSPSRWRAGYSTAALVRAGFRTDWPGRGTLPRRLRRFEPALDEEELPGQEGPASLCAIDEGLVPHSASLIGSPLSGLSHLLTVTRLPIFRC
jgi:hypothetical protein